MRLFKRHHFIYLTATCVFIVLTATIAGKINSEPVSSAENGFSSFLPALFMPPPPADSIALVEFIPPLTHETITVITHANDERVFVATQQGVIRIVDPNPDGQTGTVRPQQYLNLVASVEKSFEEGLLGLAFDPDYAETGYFYVTYNEKRTDPVFGGNLILARFKVRSGDPGQAERSSEVRLLSLPKTFVDGLGASRVHNAGDLHFGPDGFLYMSLGDGGPDPGEVSYRPADISNHGQRRDILWGKIIRLDVRGIDPNGVAPDCFGDVATPPYTIPADNPMVDGAGGMCDEIWSRGWRNPWRFSFDKVTGDMYIGEVGEERYEEVNRETAGTPGLNYGWPCYQGTYLHNSTCQGDYVFPEYQYNHDAGDCSIIGGFVYRGQTFPTLLGQYLFSDFCSRSIWRMPTLESGDVVEVLSGDGYPVWTAFGEDADGEMYIGGYLGGQVFKITEP